MTELSGDSSEQREAEEWLVNALSTKLGLSLTKKRLDLPEGGWIELDAFYESPLVLCEVWAHICPPKSAQNQSSEGTAKTVSVSMPVNKSDCWFHFVVSSRMRGILRKPFY